MQPAEQIANGHVQEISLLDQIANETARIGARYMPTLSVKQFTEREKLLRELKDMLVGPTPENPEGIDYGVIPGTKKPTLLLPGAQKICTFFGYVPHYTETAIEAWTADQFGEPLFYYKYTCCLFKNNEAVGEGIGSASSWESKYRYRWMRADQLPAGTETTGLLSRGGKQTLFVYEFALEKAETTGQYGKPAEYWQQFQDAITARTARRVNKPFKNKPNQEAWGYEIDLDSVQYRVPNADFADTINTCQKMGQKRAYIAATLSATGASQYFTQDLEDMEHIDTGGHPKGTQEAADHVAAQKIAAAKSSVPATTPPTAGPATESGGAGVGPSSAASPELDALMKRCINIKEFEMVCGELLDIIGAEYDQATRTKVWRDAVAQAGGGNVSANRSKWLPVVKFVNDAAAVIADSPKQELEAAHVE